MGGGSDAFLRYDIPSNTWFPITSNTPQFSDGAALTADTAEGVIYALQGGGSREFWSYNIYSNSWSRLVDAPRPVLSGGALTFARRGGEKFVYAIFGGGSPAFYQYARFGPALGGGIQPQGNTYNWYCLHELYCIDEQNEYKQLWASSGAWLGWIHRSDFVTMDTIFCAPCDPHYGLAYFQRQVIAYSPDINDWRGSAPLRATPGPGASVGTMNFPPSLVWQLFSLTGNSTSRVQSRLVVPPGTHNWDLRPSTPAPQLMGAAVAYGEDFYYYAFLGGGNRWFGKHHYIYDDLGGGGEQSKGATSGENIAVCANPNPFSHGTFVSFSVPERCRYRAIVYNANGEVIRTLLDHELSPGTHSVSWNRCSDSGTRVSGGVYLLRLETARRQSVVKLVVR
ncbi:MAG: hypothetical protein ABIK44_01120 [candidate division WOR-3 bacterium]